MADVCQLHQAKRLTMRVYMQHIAEEEAPRFYQLWLQQDLIGGWTLVREWGKMGAKGRVKKDHFETHEAALAALERVRDAQVNRGFQIMYIKGQEAGLESSNDTSNQFQDSNDA